MTKRVLNEHGGIGLREHAVAGRQAGPLGTAALKQNGLLRENCSLTSSSNSQANSSERTRPRNRQGRAQSPPVLQSVGRRLCSHRLEISGQAVFGAATGPASLWMGSGLKESREARRPGQQSVFCDAEGNRVSTDSGYERIDTSLQSLHRTA